MAEKALSSSAPHDDLGWHPTRSLTLWLLVLWFGTTFVSLFFGRELSGVTVLGCFIILLYTAIPRWPCW